MFKWFYCDLCEVQAIRCEECGNTSCNGSGCKKCLDDFRKAIEMVGDGTAPPIDTLEPNGARKAIDDLFAQYAR